MTTNPTEQTDLEAAYYAADAAYYAARDKADAAAADAQVAREEAENAHEDAIEAAYSLLGEAREVYDAACQEENK